MQEFKTFDFVDAYEAVIPWKRRLARELPFIKNKIPDQISLVLDSACGTGHHSLEFRAIARRVIGLDNSPAMIKQALTNNSKINMGYSQFILSSLSHLPFRKNLFDTILTLGASLPLLGPKAMNQALDDSYSVLKQNGIYIFQTRNFQLIAKNAQQNETARYLPIKQGVLKTGQDVIFIRYYDIKMPKNQAIIEAINFIFLIKELDIWKMTTYHSKINPVAPNELIHVLNSIGFDRIRCYDSYQELDADFSRSLDLVFVTSKPE